MVADVVLCNSHDILFVILLYLLIATHNKVHIERVVLFTVLFTYGVSQRILIFNPLSTILYLDHYYFYVSSYMYWCIGMFFFWPCSFANLVTEYTNHKLETCMF